MLYVFKHKKIYGVQCHPDIPPEYVADFLENTETIDYAKKNHREIDKNNRGLMMHILNELMIN
jgi:GMP synthase-like glutamine amidotransferase